MKEFENKLKVKCIRKEELLMLNGFIGKVELMCGDRYKLMRYVIRLFLKNQPYEYPYVGKYTS